jgi:hypothetical protein
MLLHALLPLILPFMLLHALLPLILPFMLPLLISLSLVKLCAGVCPPRMG